MTKLGSRSHKLDCRCPWCTKSGGLEFHKPGCGCSWCTKSGGPGSIADHKPDCQCAFHSPGRGVENHRNGCTCTVCLPGVARDTSIELAMQALLTELGIEFETQVRFGQYVVDIYVPDRALVIECDGEYWHQDKQHQRKRDSYLRRQGLSVWHFPQRLIESNPMPKLTRALAN